MIKRFTVWMEDQMQKRRLIHILLDRLGYDRNSLDNSDLIISDRKISNIEDAINALPVSDQNKEAMINFARQNQHSLSLKALANKINPDDVETQDTTSSQPAVLPQGNQPAPKPVNKQQMMMQQQMQQQQPMQ